MAEQMVAFIDSGQSVSPDKLRKFAQRLLEGGLGARPLRSGRSESTPVNGDTAPLMGEETADLRNTRFWQFFERAPLGISIVSEDDIILEVNRLFVDMVGYSRDELIGRSSYKFIHPDFLEKKKDCIRRLLSGRIAQYQLEEKRVRKDGSQFWTRMTSTLIFDPHYGQRVRLNMIEDIQDRKAAEEAVQRAQKKVNEITSAIPGGVYEFRLTEDGHGELLFASPGYGKIFEAPSKDLIGDFSVVQSFMHDEDSVRMMSSLKKSALELKPWSFEFRIYTGANQQKWVRAEATPSREQDGSTLWRGLVTDVTERKQIERELLQAKTQAEKATRAKSEFLTNISHEIRTPMNAILGFSELLSAEIKDPIQNQYLQSIRSAGTTLLDLINDFLDLSRIEAGKVTLRPEPVVLADVIEDIRSIFMIRTEQKGLEFWIDVDPQLPPVLLLDETRLRQILFNLVGNAVKFTKQGYVRVKLSITRGPAPGPAMTGLEIVVEDTGIGIPQHEQTRIFESFEQRRGQSKEFGGSGLGLAITKKLVEVMQGTITVSSEKGQGSIFTVTLGQVPVAQLPQSMRKREEGPLRFEPATLFIIDHEDDAPRLLERYLNQTGIAAWRAANHRQAVTLVRSRPADIVLIDPYMPGLDTVGLVEMIRGLAPKGIDPAVVLLDGTSGGMGHQRLRERISPQGVLSKPLDKRSFQRILRALLAHKIKETGPASRGSTSGVPSLESNGEAQKPSFASCHDRHLLSPAALTHLTVLSDNDHKRISRVPDIEDIQNFASAIHHVGEEEGVWCLLDYAAELEAACGSFDVNRMNRLIGRFPALMGHLLSSAR